MHAGQEVRIVQHFLGSRAARLRDKVLISIVIVRVHSPSLSKVGPLNAEGHAASTIPQHELFLVKQLDLFTSVLAAELQGVLLDQLGGEELLHRVDCLEGLGLRWNQALFNSLAFHG